MKHLTILLISLFFLICCTTPKTKNSDSTDSTVRYVIHYDGNNSTGVGGMGAGSIQEDAVYFNSTKLNSVVGGKIVAFQVYNNVNGSHTDPLPVTIDIFGKGTTSAPGSLLFTNPASLHAGWNELVVSPGITINSGNEIWAGCQFPTDYWPIGLDAGPQVSGVNFCKNISPSGSWGGLGGANLNIRIVVEK